MGQIKWLQYREQGRYLGTGSHPTDSGLHFEFEIVRPKPEAKTWQLRAFEWVKSSDPRKRTKLAVTNLNCEFDTVKTAKAVAEQYIVTPGQRDSIARCQRAVTAVTGSEVLNSAIPKES